MGRVGPANGARTFHPLVVIVSVILGMMLAAIDATVVATALPTIVGDLHGLDKISWVLTAYLLTSTIAAPLSGKFGDLFGRKRVVQFPISLFLLGSVLCCFATSMPQLIGFRALQGLGGGGLMVL